MHLETTSSIKNTKMGFTVWVLDEIKVATITVLNLASKKRCSLDKKERKAFRTI